jgi:uncharacterized OB-fold protein
LTQTEAEAQAPIEKTQKPIVPFLRLPEAPGQKAYLVGSKCKACGLLYLGQRRVCGKCLSRELEEARLSDQGELYVFSVVHQTAPGIPVPYIAAIVDLDDGVSVRANVEGLDPNKPDKSWFGTRLQMFTEKVRTDREGNDVIAFKFRPKK